MVCVAEHRHDCGLIALRARVRVGMWTDGVANEGARGHVCGLMELRTRVRVGMFVD